MTAESSFAQLIADTRFCRQLKHPGRPVHGPALLLTFLTSPGLWSLACGRVANYSTFRRNLRNPLWWIARLLESVGLYLNVVINRSRLPGDCALEAPIFLSDRGYIILGAESVGASSIIHHRVTIGVDVASTNLDRPVVGANVWIGPDCVISGSVRIGDGTTLLPGSYLTVNVPPRSVVKGNPARVVRENFDNSAVRSSLAIVAQLPAD